MNGKGLPTTGKNLSYPLPLLYSEECQHPVPSVQISYFKNSKTLVLSWLPQLILIWVGRPKINISVFVSCVRTPTDLANFFISFTVARTFHTIVYSVNGFVFLFRKRCASSSLALVELFREKGQRPLGSHLPFPRALAFLE